MSPDLTRRRIALQLAAGMGALAGVGAPIAQSRSGPARVGVLSPSTPRDDPYWQAMVERLAQLGWAEGRSLELTFLTAASDFSRLPGLAEQLVRKPVDVLVSGQSPGTRAAIRATRTIPVVMVPVGDPLALGFVTNLARPGGNVTGVSNLARELTAKRMALLKEAIPEITRVGVLYNPEDPVTVPQIRDARNAAAALELKLVSLPLKRVDDIVATIERGVAQNVHALFRLADPFTVAIRKRIVEAALKHRLPTMLLVPEDAEAGGLLAYWSDHTALYRRAAEYVDRILRGEKPGEMAVEQASQFQLVVNLATADKLGVTLPASILTRADRVIR